VRDVRIGKLIEIDLRTADRAEAERRLDEMCRRLLANPVIEDYRYEVLDASDVSPAAAHPVQPGP
jgi:phosphoribosylformylglycinamidine synthase